MEGSVRKGFVSACIFLLVAAGAVVHVINSTNSSQPGRAVVMSEIMAYCHSEANASPDRREQMTFLLSHPLSVAPDNKWVQTYFGEWGTAIFVRYLVDGSNPQTRCQFALVRTANHPEYDAERLRWTRDGQPFTPGDNELCASSQPPIYDAQQHRATLRCDTLVQD